MTSRIALNGLGRIGKLVLRDLIDSGAEGQMPGQEVRAKQASRYCVSHQG